MSFLSICKQTILDDATELWGIRVARVEIKDVRIPVQLQRSMAAEAEATREARAKVRARPPRGASCLALENTSFKERSASLSVSWIRKGFLFPCFY